MFLSLLRRLFRYFSGLPHPYKNLILLIHCIVVYVLYVHLRIYIYTLFLRYVYLYLIESVYFLPLKNQVVPFWGGTGPSRIPGEIQERATVLTGVHDPPLPVPSLPLQQEGGQHPEIARSQVPWQ